ncbi:hypothetical protein Chor_012658, partial [Crotalus horridus]
PSSVQNLTIENCTVDSLQIGWKPPRDPQSYTYTYCVCLIDCAIANESPFLAKGLKGGTMYTIEVRAVMKSNLHGDTMTINVITATNSPENITVESYSPYYLSIAWNPPKDLNAMDYLYRISWWREDGTQVGSYSILGFNYTICSLKPGLVYLVKVISDFNEILSEAIKLWTLTYGSRGNETYPKPLNQAVLHGLTPSTNDTFTLFSTVGNGSLSRDSVGLQQHEATKPEQVSDFICLPLQDSWSLKLSWTCPASAVSKIVVLVSDQAWKNELNCSESVVIKELQPAKVYQIKIKTFWYNQYAVSDTVECSINTTEGQMPQRSRIQTWDFLESLVQYLCWLSHAIATRSCQTAPSALLLKTRYEVGGGVRSSVENHTTGIEKNPSSKSRVSRQSLETTLSAAPKIQRFPALTVGGPWAVGLPQDKAFWETRILLH